MDRDAAWRWLERASALFAVVMFVVVLSPDFEHLDRYGIGDWDQMQAHRYVFQKTVLRFHQFPFWDPWACGGHSWWGAPESGIDVVPWAPLYLLLDLRVALRLEIAITAAVGCFGAWLVARRFSRSPAAHLLIVAVFALSPRWALQVAGGHTMHLGYAGLPWALYFLDRAAEETSASRVATRDVAGLAVTLALMLYTGAIYPLPHTVVLLSLYALVLAISRRSWLPLGIVGVSGVCAVGLSAPRLLPLLETLKLHPRLVPSPEHIGFGEFLMVHTTKLGAPHPPIGPWAWNEFAIYVGWLPLAAMLVALVAFREMRERALVYTGLFAWILGFGRLGALSPWGLFHDWLPLFKSQRVPTRWLYPALLFMLLAIVAIVARWTRRLGVERRRALWFEAGYLVLVACIALDVDLESRRSWAGQFTVPPPAAAESLQPYHQEWSAPPELMYAVPFWTTPAMPAMMANIGVIHCGTFPDLHEMNQDSTGHVPGIAARGVGDPEYRGEVYFTSGGGRATITSWTPNAVSVRWEGAEPGDTLVLNQNWDPGWHAMSINGLVGARVQTASGDLRFSYVSPFFWLGVVLCVATLVGLVVIARRRRETRPARRNA